MNRANLRLQDRDLALLQLLDELELGDLDLLATHFYPTATTPRACQRRLQLYVAHGLVHRLPLTVNYLPDHPGRLPTIYRLSRRGAEVLETLTGTPPIRRPAKRDPRPETVLHRLGVARFHLAMNDACARRQLPVPRWLHEYDTYPTPKLTAPASERFILYERFTLADGRKVICWPDASCLLTIPGVSGTAHPLIIYLEYDRSTERLSQVAAKLPGYQQLLTTAAWRRHWPVATAPTVRIFFVVPSLDRLRHLAAAFQPLPGADAIRLATVTDITPERLLTDPIWRTVNGECLPILRAPLPLAS